MEGRQLAVVTDFRDEENGTFTLKKTVLKLNSEVQRHLLMMDD